MKKKNCKKEIQKNASSQSRHVLKLFGLCYMIIDLAAQQYLRYIFNPVVFLGYISLVF